MSGFANLKFDRFTQKMSMTLSTFLSDLNFKFAKPLSQASRKKNTPTEDGKPLLKQYVDVTSKDGQGNGFTNRVQL